MTVSLIAVFIIGLALVILAPKMAQTPSIALYDGESIPYYSANGNNVGDVVVLGTNSSMIGIVTDAITAGTTGTVFLTRTWVCPKDTTSVFAIGDPVYWNATGSPTVGTANSGCMTTIAEGNIFAGTATQAQVAADSTVNVKLSGFTQAPLQSAYYNIGANANDNVSNTTAAVAFATTAIIPASTLEAGDIIHIHAVALVTAQASTDTQAVLLNIETAANTYTLVCNTGLVNAANGATCIIDADIIVESVGNSGTFTGEGTYVFGAAATATPFPFANQINTGINTNLPITIQVEAKANAAATGNVIQLVDLEVSLKR